jgi:hypothetical protein
MFETEGAVKDAGEQRGARVVWPSPSTGYSSQQNGNLGTTNWVAVAQTPTDNGTVKSIVVTPPSGRKFYRLVK